MLYEFNEFNFSLDFYNQLLEIAPNNREAHNIHGKIKLLNPPEVNFIKMILKRVSISS